MLSSQLLRRSIKLAVHQQKCFKHKGKWYTSANHVLPTDTLEHEKFIQHFKMKPEKVKKELRPIRFESEKLFEGKNPVLKNLCSLEHFTPEDVTELVIKRICNNIGFAYTHTNDVLEVAVIRSSVKIWELQSKYRNMRRQRKMKFVILKENEKKNKLLEQLRNTKFENYAKIMQELDMELHFNPELIVHRNENIEKMDEMKVRALYHKLNTERQEKERMQKFQQVKEKFARQIEQGDLPEKEKLAENAQASLNA